MQGALCQPCSLSSVFWSSVVHTQFTQWLGFRVPLPFRYPVSSSLIMEEEQRSHGGGGRETRFAASPSWRMIQWLPFTLSYYCGPETMESTLCRLSLQSSHEPWKLGTIHLMLQIRKLSPGKINWLSMSGSKVHPPWTSPQILIWLWIQCVKSGGGIRKYTQWRR